MMMCRLGPITIRIQQNTKYSLFLNYFKKISDLKKNREGKYRRKIKTHQNETFTNHTGVIHILKHSKFVIFSY